MSTYARDLVRYHPGQTTPAVDGLSFDLPVGLTAIPGRAASGMSTVAGLAGGAYLPNSGTVVIAGCTVTDLGGVARAVWTNAHVRYVVHVAPVADGAAGPPLATAWRDPDPDVALVVAHEPTVFLPGDAQARVRAILRALARRLPVLVTNDGALLAEAHHLQLPPTPHHRPTRVDAWRLADLGVPVLDDGARYCLALPSEAHGLFPRAVPRFVTPWTWRAVRQVYGRVFGLADYASLAPGVPATAPPA